MLSYDDLEWAGVKQCFADFYDKIREKIMDDEILQRDADEHMTEIADFIALRLYKSVFHQNKVQSQREYEVYSKIQNLQWVSSEAFGVPVDPITKPMWEKAAQELQSIDRAYTPKAKQACIFSCYKVIDSAFSLFSTEEGINNACADDIL